MPSSVKLDLVGVGWPVCLLECKNVLNELPSGQELEVRIHDPDVFKDLVTIIERSGNHRVRYRQVGADYMIYVQKK